MVFLFGVKVFLNHYDTTSTTKFLDRIYRIVRIEFSETEQAARGQLGNYFLFILSIPSKQSSFVVSFVPSWLSSLINRLPRPRRPAA